MTYDEASRQKYRDTIIAKYMNNYPDLTKEEAYEAWRADMRLNGSKGGKNGTGHKFAHGAVDPRHAGKLSKKGKKHEEQ